jgi:vancomycin permeability regulator SanA
MDTATVRRELVEICSRNRPYMTYIFTHSLMQVCISRSLFPISIIIIIIIIIITVMIGATGIVMRSLRKNLEDISGKHSIDSLQKTAVLGTSHIIRKVLQCEA